MGKKSRQKHRARDLAQNKRPVQPDDHFSFGPIQILRFGKLGLIQNRMSEKQFEEMQARLAGRFSDVCAEIDDKVSRIAGIVAQLPPGELLKRAHWGYVLQSHRNRGKLADDKAASLALRMVDYVQSIVVSVPPANIRKPDVSEENWRDLETTVDALFTQLNTEYQICRTSFDRRNSSEYDEDFDKYCTAAQLHWCNVRGRRYIVHHIPHYQGILAPHDDILREAFGLSVDDLVAALLKIQHSMTEGVLRAAEDLRKFQEATSPKLLERMDHMESVRREDLPDVMRHVVEKNGWEEWRDDVLGRFFGFDLFDVKKLTELPDSFLDRLSWTPGEDAEFFAEGDFRGWPLRVWPVFKRPFIKLDGRYYCFEFYSLFDNFYRVVQRIISAEKPSYASIWNERQKAVSEQLPIRFFEKLLPGAQVFRNSYYKWHVGGGGGDQWCETDAILIWEDHLFIIEVKAGAFTYTPPATDFPAYVASLRNLVLKPAQQGQRFLQYLKSHDEVAIYDGNHEEVARLRQKDFDHVTICAVTLDTFTELAAQIQHLGKIGVDVGDVPVWALSVDDLRVYADVFDNPLVFLHFVEQRMRAFHSELIRTDDELDHLGLYIEHNVYTEYARDFSTDATITWHGYRTKIDEFFAKRVDDPSAECPLKQQMPTRLKEILHFLPNSGKRYRRRIASTLLDSGSSMRDNVCSEIDQQLAEQRKSGRARPLSTYGGANITLFCWQRGLLERDAMHALDHGRAVMLVTQERERTLLELTYDHDGFLVDIDFRIMTLDSISPLETDRLKPMADKIRQRRIDRAKQNGKIGRNQPCPCGSGKKYEQCCLRIPS